MTETPETVNFTKFGNIKAKGKEKEEYLYSAVYTTHSLKALRHGSHSFTCKLHHACISFISVHQMAPPITELNTRYKIFQVYGQFMLVSCLSFDQIHSRRNYGILLQG